jgi:hypothetical protein
MELPLFTEVSGIPAYNDGDIRKVPTPLSQLALESPAPPSQLALESHHISYGVHVAPTTFNLTY